MSVRALILLCFVVVMSDARKMRKLAPQSAAIDVPLPVKPSGGCKALVPLWSNCHGRETCCVSGAQCSGTGKFAQCMPGAPVPVASKRAQCPFRIQKWGNCLANPTCCAQGTTCHSLSRWRAQCR